MTSQQFIERHHGGDRAILVHIDFYQKTREGALAEFQELVLSADAQILSIITGKRTVPEVKYFVGSGKAEEIQLLVKNLSAEIVIFNHTLTPAQERNLEKLLQCRVIDRNGLILDIFAKRARTFEGKLQVELAQLKHISTRLVRGWTHLERQRGGIGLRGPGETQLEVDRRLIDTRIRSITKQLAKVAQQREQSRRARKRASVLTVAIVGYTNAGKSTLFNRMTHAAVYTANKLFATLDPTLRHIELPILGKIILADTVGFIQDLPHQLIAAFHATLEETGQADLLLHVVDAHAAHVDELMADVQSVLTEIHANAVPQLLVFNKIDLTKITPRIERAADGKPCRVFVSALTGEGLSLLNEAIVELLAEAVITCMVVLNPEEAQLYAALHRIHVITAETIDETGAIHLSLKIQFRDYQRLLDQR